MDQPRRVLGRIGSVPGAHEAAVVLWKHYESAGEFPEALTYARIATNKHRYHGFCGNDDTAVLVRLDLADLLRKLGQCDEALAIAKPWQEQHPLFLTNVAATRAQAPVKQIRAEFPI